MRHKTLPTKQTTCIIIIIIIIVDVDVVVFVVIIIYSLEFRVTASLSNSMSPQVSRTLLNNAVVWTVSTRTLTSKSSRPFNNPLVTIPKAPITIGIIVTFMPQCFFFLNSLAKSRYLPFFSHSFSFILGSAGTAKSTILQIFFFSRLLLGLVFWPRLEDRSECQSQRSLYMLFSKRCWVVCMPFVGRVKFKFHAHLPVDYLAHPVMSSLILLC